MNLITTPSRTPDWANPWLAWPGTVWPAMLEAPDTDTHIRIEELESDHHHIIRAEVPGIDPDKDVTLRVEGDTVDLSIRRERHDENRDGRHTRSEFRYGSFRRVIRLPRIAMPDDVKASYKDGILEVRIKTNGKETPGHRVPVTRG
jgi:HSP20 family molecular chaperone IbpA